MYAVDFTLKKNNKDIKALIWNWIPEEGCFEAIVDEQDSDGDIRTFELSDIKKGIIYSDRDREFSTYEDLFDKAKADGWLG